VDKDVLQRFLAQRLSLEQIGKRVGRHPSTVSYWLKKHGLAPPNCERHLAKGFIDRAVIATLVDRGFSIRQIAAELSVSATTVRHWLDRYGLKTVHTEAQRDRPEGALPRQVFKTCSKHGHTQFVMEGRGYYRCARCRQERVARWRRRMKETLVAESGGRCAICGYSEYVGALEFHHLDPGEKEFGLSVRGMTRSLERMREEVRKCVLLCANCHAEVEGGLTRYP
jgi:hypothetical protein